MRLSQIKLSGFKSFVDSTHIPTPGQIVGIVGPNGCGKSNIIDALRWVLGESKASALRGKSMQDVIFSGSVNRKPVARASVELVFDNSLGRAAGQWSEYAEIAVRRVLQRDAESSYFINNIRVRRKDIADVFLGTGLGGHAYAIIEQGMISRIIEADPEDLKVFLEEAAGISKYRERRRETELRLKTTRENLRRVEDICGELKTRIEHLDAQANVAKCYHELQTSLKTAQNLLWLRKKIQAGEARKRLLDEAARLENELEAENANLRHIENRLVQMREKYDLAGGRLQEVQGSLYAANAEVSRLQQQIDHSKSNRSGLEKRIGSEKREMAALDCQYEEAIKAGELLEAEAVQAFGEREECASALEMIEKHCAEAENAAKKARSRHEEARLAISSIEHEEKIEQTNLAHIESAIGQLGKKREKLLESGLQEPDEAGLSRIDEKLAEVTQLLESGGRDQDDLSKKLEIARASMNEAAMHRGEQEKRLAGARARLVTLQEIRSGLELDLSAWLVQNGLDAFPRLRSKIRVQAGWENALESVLAGRINAVLVDDPVSNPPGEAVFAKSGEVPGPPAGKSLLSLVELEEPAFGGALREWLSAVHIAQDLDEALMARSNLEPGAQLVTPEGHIVTRHSIHYRGADPKVDGILVREKEIEKLILAEKKGESLLETAKKALAQYEGEASMLDGAVKAGHAALSALQKTGHDLQIERVTLAEANQRALDQSRRIASELQEIEVQHRAESEKRLAIEKRMMSVRENIAVSRGLAESEKQQLATAERLLEEKNRQLRQASGKKREAEFREKSCALKMEELRNRMAFLERNRTQAMRNLEKLQEEMATLDVSSLEAMLQGALAERQDKESVLLEARRTNEALSFDLRDLDGKRQQSEQKLTPLRARINDTHLKEQEARIAWEQFDASLKTAGANEAALLAMEMPEERQLQLKITKLNGEIESLGAVNLAAFDELNAATARRGYLEAQVSDLSQAIETLEDAIRRIDRETRERLMSTYDAVNRNFSELFNQLFGGGQARLVLTGEQIIDCGMEIEAQPPGKKNASIRLLSGGEKALTALSLVFSLFKLNPAPFCLLDEVDAPLDDSNTERFCDMVRKMADHTQFLFISHNKITMEMAHQLIGVTMQEQGVSRIVAVDVEAASRQSGGIMAN